jgi:hypothetical protein
LSRSTIAGEEYHAVSPALMLRTCVGDATAAVPPAALHVAVGTTAESSYTVDSPGVVS